MSGADGGASTLGIALFGSLEVRLSGAPLPRLRSRKGLWLLALLALRHGREVDRHWLVGVLWPDSPETQALYNLRRSLTDLRRALGPEAVRLRSHDHTLCLDLEGAAVDVVAFDAAMARGEESSLKEAIALYRGPLLEGCTEEWAFQERQAREQAYLRALEALAAGAMARSDPAAAEGYLRRATGVDPLRESAQRGLMQALAASGNYAAALLTYRELRLRLHRELNAEPDPETKALFQQLRAEARRAQEEPSTPARPLAAPAAIPRRPLIAGGTVTFLFTDIEGSSRLWEEQPEGMREALARHDTLLRHVIQGNAGWVFKTLGDGFCAAFATAPEAIAAALQGQRALQDFGFWVLDFGLDESSAGDTKSAGPQDTPKRESSSPADTLDPKSKTQNPKLRVRMALHTGAAEEREGDYFGPPLNRVARLLDAGHGGQILLSLATQELGYEALPEGARLRDLGEHRLKDLSRPERIFQLLHPDLPGDFPPLRSLEVSPNNLPQQVTSFIGREQEMAEVKRLLANTRLLTLIGSGGAGKTRVALQVAADLLPEYGDGVWLIDLAPLAAPTSGGYPGLVPQTVATALGIREQPGQPLIRTLLAGLKAKRLLLVLDNCEHLLAACATLADTLLRGCPGVRILATSREGLNIAGETTYRLPSLPLPDPRQLPPTLQGLTQYEAVHLFIDRAVAVLPAFTVTNQNAPAVAQVCYRLDGIPLALELAAARVKALPVETINERLDDRFRLLTGGSRTALPRHQTLRALIDWSYDLLSEPERGLLRRLSVFAGGWTLEAAEAICADFGFWVLDFGLGPTRSEPLKPPTCPPLPAIQNPKSKIQNEDVLDLLTALVEKSMVIYEAGAGGAEGALWGPVPGRIGGEADRGYPPEAGPGRSPGGAKTRYRLLETVRQYARDRLLESGEGETVRARHRDFFLALAERAEPELRGPEQVRSMDRLEAEHDNLRGALEWCQARGDGELGLRLAGALGRFWGLRGYLAEGRQWVTGALAAGSEASARARMKAHLAAAELAYRQGDLAAARSFGGNSLALARAMGEGWSAAYSLAILTITAIDQGDHERAMTLAKECLALAREEGDKWLISIPLLQLGVVAVERGDYEQARMFLEESQALSREVGDRWSMTLQLLPLGAVAHGQGHDKQARALYKEALVLSRELADTEGMREALDGLARVAGEQGQAERAARVAGAAEALREALGASLPGSRRARQERCVAAARAALGEEAFAAAWAEGRAMPLEQAVAYALEEAAGD